MQQEMKDRILELVEEKFPGWKGFEDPRFVEEEIDYKKAAIQKAQEELGREDLQRLLDQEDCEEIIRRIERRGREPHFLFLGVPLKGGLAVVKQPGLDKPSYCRAFFDLLYGEGDSVDRFGRYLNYLEEHDRPSQWPFPTYFLFMVHPETEFFITPRLVNRFLKEIGSEFQLDKPNADDYGKVLKLAKGIREAFEDYKPRDMVDIQSLVWVAGRQIKKPSQDANKLFESFRKSERDRFTVELRRQRAKEIQNLLDGSNEISLDQFNKEVWRFCSSATLNGEEVGSWIGSIDTISEGDFRKLKKGFDQGNLEVQGNVAWGSGTQVFGANEPDIVIKETRIKQAIEILNGENLNPIEKWRRISAIKGFGDNITTGLVMLFHPNEFCIFNSRSRSGAGKFGVRTAKLEEFEEDIQGLKDRLGAEDFLELDWFLYRQTFDGQADENKQESDIFKIFEDEETVNWAFDFIRDTLHKLGVEDGSDERVAITLPGTRKKLRVNFCKWLILEFNHPRDDDHPWLIPVLADEMPDAKEKVELPFAQSEDEPPVGLFYSSIEDIQEMSPETKSAFVGALKHIRSRFSGWSRSQYRKHHQSELASAIFDPTLRDFIFTGDWEPEDDKENIVDPRPSISGDYRAPSFEEIYLGIRNKGLRLGEEIIQRYHLSLRSRKFVILSGISGTGKTWLAQAYAKVVGAESCVIPVAPNWTTNEDLLGFFNPVDGQYHETEFTRFLRSAAAHYKASQQEEKEPIPFHLILDEMNLARVEYYFAKFLSAMEIRQREGVAEIELGPTGTVTLAPNLYFIGTVNIDETTHDFADKIYDRAQLIELPVTREEMEAHIGDEIFKEVLLELWSSLEPVKPFAYRIVDEIRVYLQSAQEIGLTWEAALDHQIHQKILPKLKGTEDHLGTALDELARITADRFPLSNAKAQRMLEGFRRNGFVSYF